ncbi:MAG: MBL fold metallo-hydrolase [Euryarchaeota archaeon]|nr:MBL fold metallo-hydrolase [Euryarchaeota archaeon]
MTVHYLPGAGFDSNVFLITGDRPFLVDTGTGAHLDRTVARISELGVAGGIDRIVLTHRHFDHVGGAWELAKRFSAEVMVHELDAQPLREGDSFQTFSEMFGIEMSPMEVSAFVEGEVLSSGEHDFEILHTPGHSAGSVSLFDREGGSLICGDTVFVDGVGRWDLPSGNLKDLLHSVKKLVELEPVDLYPGHGPCAFGDARDQIAGALRYLGEA